MKHEKHGVRPEDLSLRHRRWGRNVPCTDIDFLMIEFCYGKPTALVEYKHCWAKRNMIADYDPMHPKNKAIRILADNSDIPFFWVYYCNETWAFEVLAYNRKALEHVPFTGRIMSERQYVELLHSLSGSEIVDAEPMNEETPEIL